MATLVDQRLLAHLVEYFELTIHSSKDAATESSRTLGDLPAHWVKHHGKT